MWEQKWGQGGKGSPWACAEKFSHTNEIAALTQSHDKLIAGMQHRYTVFIRIVAAATINFSLAGVRLLIEGGSW